MNTESQFPVGRAIRSWAGATLLGSGILLRGPADAQEPPAAGAPAVSPAAEKKADDTESEFRNWIRFGVGSTFIQGDKAQFLERKGGSIGAYGGIEEFHLEHDIGKRGLFKIDGRGIFDNHDYSIHMELSHPDKGFLRAGYSEFRTWYDGSGGFFPRNGQWFSFYDERLALDRGDAFVHAGLRLPSWPEIDFKYTHQFRRGFKDSLSWGESALTAGAGARGIVPSFRQIDERRDIIEADVKQGFGSTDLRLGFRYELGKQDDWLNMRRTPNTASDRHLSQRESITSDLVNAHAFTETRFNEKTMLTTGYSYTRLNTGISGSRIYGSGYEAGYDPLFARRQTRDEGFLSLGGGSLFDQYVMSLNLLFTPWENVTIVPALRVEKQDLDNLSYFAETTVGAAPALVSSQENFSASTSRGILDVSESLDVSYNGITNWVFYARGNWMQGEGNLDERENDLTTGVNDLLRASEFERRIEKYTAGVNWYPLARLNMGAQYYHKIRSERYVHRDDSTPNRSGNRYPAFLIAQDFTTDDVNYRLTLRPVRNVTLVSRYDFQLSSITMQGDGTAPVESGKITTHIISQSASWTPLARLYLQADASYTLDRTDSPVLNSLPGSGLVLNGRNNYYTASGLVGFVLSDKTDLQTHYSWYRADNYQDNSAFSQPFGAGAEEHQASLTLTHRVSKRLQWSARYGYVNHRDQTSGGNNNVQGHGIYTSIEYRF
jgi:hypothetical protein